MEKIISLVIILVELILNQQGEVAIHISRICFILERENWLIVGILIEEKPANMAKSADLLKSVVIVIAVIILYCNARNS